MNFKDRESQYKNRYKLKDITTGEEKLYDLTLSDGVASQEGTPLNATTFNGMQDELKGYTVSKATELMKTMGYTDMQAATNAVAIGNSAKATAEESVAVGYRAYASTAKSVAIGKNAQSTHVTCVAIGDETCSDRHGATCVGSGSRAGSKSVEACDSTAFGYLSEAMNAGATAIGSGSCAYSLDSTAIGREARIENAYAPRSIAIGHKARANGSGSVSLGADANSNGNGIAIGSVTAYDKEIRIGTSNHTTAYIRGQIITPSDERDKADIVPLKNCLNFINAVEPIQYVVNDRDFYMSADAKTSPSYQEYEMAQYDVQAHRNGDKKRERKRAGVSAQQVDKVMKELYNTDNYADIVYDNFHNLTEKPTNLENRLRVAYSEFIPFLIGAIKEQQKQIDELKQLLLSR